MTSRVMMDESASEETSGAVAAAETPDHTTSAESPAPANGTVTRASGPASRIAQPAPKRTLVDKLEGFVSRLSTKNNFWHRVCSFIWLPYAFRSGIRMNRDQGEFTAVLPFRRFNRNWYNAMAGAALLANSEVAGGMYVFKIAGKDYTVVCRELRYRFLRPCFGPAVYRVKPKADVPALVAGGGEFNVDIEINIYQGLVKAGEREKRVGKCDATFHVTPKVHHKAKKQRGSEKATS